MASIEISIGDQKYTLRGEESEEHLREVAELVKRRVEAIRKKAPHLNLQKAAMLAAFDFASHMIKNSRKAADSRAAIVAKAKQLIERVELELHLQPPKST